MEIFSVRSSQSFQFRHNQKSHSRPEDSYLPAKHEKSVTSFPDGDAAAASPDPLSINQIREMARNGLDSGLIDQETFATLYEGLPMQAVDPSGQIIDLSGVTDTTPFDFTRYYREQLQVASSIGDPRTARILEAVVAFLNASTIR
ncbi:hypothetical protein [Gellertiella hungarica]|uniref:Uncharacterized protein n=1 Tax=Gellertiella hungarica TaxID=1572859 RepID=A0A7W6J5N7_9HYPH|nr:hypothetical protein [Gellertiella hungarica]MBB4065251.1 hypothetical protein [Gellertiella hungarica]